METITIDYNMNLEQMIDAGKKFLLGYEKNFTEEYFALPSKTGKVVLEPKFFYFDRGIQEPISSEDVIKEMEADGFRPAKIEELLACYPLISGGYRVNHSISALGSVVEIDGVLRVPGIGFGGRVLYLRLDPFNTNWGRNSHLLGVREIRSEG